MTVMMHFMRTLVLSFIVWSGTASAQSLPLERITLPPGFSIERYAQIDGARSMAVVVSLNTVFVGTRGSNVYAIIDANRDGKAEGAVRVLSGLRVPNGVAWKDGYLYVAKQHRIVRFKANTLETLKRAKAEVLYNKLPDDAAHGWRYAGFGPDGQLYVSVGAPCNICRVQGLEGTIVRLPPTGAGHRKFMHRACVIQSASTFNQRPMRCISPTTAPTIWAMIARPTNSTMRQRKACGSAIHILVAAVTAPLNFAGNHCHTHRHFRSLTSAPMSPPLACTFIAAPCFQPTTKTMPSSCNGVRGIAASPMATG
jgi:hypothetical protein